MQNFYALLLILFSSSYVLILDYFAFSSRSIQKGLVLPLCLLLFILYRSSLSSYKDFLSHHGKWFLLLFGTILVQTLVIATDGLQSPFLILLHLFMVAIGFLFNFSVSLIFLLFSVIVILGDISYRQDVVSFFTTDPSTVILQIASLISIIPLVYIISQQYHFKEMLTTMLRDKVTTDEAILKSLNELIIVTDPELYILSVNDATERTLQKSRSELFMKPIFSVLLLKQNSGSLATKEVFFPEGDTTKDPLKVPDTFIIINSPPERNTVTMQTQVIKDLEGKVKQISFVLSFTKALSTPESSLQVAIEKARAKYEAMTENLKKELQQINHQEAQTQALFIEKIESDIYGTHTLSITQPTTTLSRIDLAKLSEQIVTVEQDFAKSLHVPLSFSIENFGKKDVEPLTVKNFPVDPKHLTGPFFTVPCDVKNTEMMLKKLLEMSILLSSGTNHPKVHLQIERGGNDTILIKLIASCPEHTKDNVSELFAPNHGKLAGTTSLQAGSGLEGYLVKSISDLLGVPLSTQYDQTPESQLVFTLAFKKTTEAK